MSHLKTSKKTKKDNKKPEKDEGMTLTEGREPVFDFNEANDVTTISAQLIMEKLRKGCDFNFSSYRALQSTANNEVNKSDAVIIISAAILNRLGANGAAQQVLADSDEAATYYANLGLDSKATLSTFTTLIAIIAPELLKASEMAITSLLSETSKSTKVTHSSSRLVAALTGVTEAGVFSRTETELSSILTNFMPRGSRTALAQQLLMDSDSDGIMPQESVSRCNSGSSSKMRPVQESDASTALTTANIMSHIKARQRGNSNDFSSTFKPIIKPNVPIAKRDNKGLGYVASDSSSEEEVIVRRKKSSKTSIKGKGKEKTSVGQKITRLAEELETALTLGSLPEADQDSELDNVSI
jgi:hypothetical protein